MGKQQWTSEDLTVDDALEGSDLVKDLRRVIKNLQARSSDLETEVKEYRTTSRSQIVEAALKANGLDSKIAKFVPADVEDIDAWAKENAEFFGAKAPEGDAGAEAGETADPVEVATQKRMATLSGQAATPATLADFNTRMRAAKSKEELADVIKEAAAAGL